MKIEFTPTKTIISNILHLGIDPYLLLIRREFCWRTLFHPVHALMLVLLTCKQLIQPVQLVQHSPASHFQYVPQLPYQIGRPALQAGYRMSGFLVRSKSKANWEGSANKPREV